MGFIFYFPWEISLMQWVQSFESALITPIATFFTLMGEEYLLILILGLCYWCIDKDLGRKVSLSMAAAMLSGSLVKGIAKRHRPYMDNSEIKCIRAAVPDADIMSVVSQGFSLPSMHASMSVGVYGMAALSTKKKSASVSAFVLPYFIGLSRIYLGVHYPTDVLSGWVLGTAMVFLLFSMEKKYGCIPCFAVTLAVGAACFFYCRDNEFFTSYGVAAGMMPGFMFEEKYVNFPMPDKWWSFVLRPLFGIAIFVVLSALLKLPVKSIPSDSLVSFQLAYRCLRYTVSGFFIIGIYPCLFGRLRFL